MTNIPHDNDTPSPDQLLESLLSQYNRFIVDQEELRYPEIIIDCLLHDFATLHNLILEGNLPSVWRNK